MVMSRGLSPQVYEDLIKHTVDLLTVIDETGVIKYESPSIEHLLGYKPEELIGENAFEYIHPEDRQGAFELFSEVVEANTDQTTGRFDFRFRHRNGSWVWLEAKGSNQTVSAIEGYVITSRDITDRKQSERILQRERDRLDEFASVVSHDLRNPLSVAKGRLELAQEESDSEHLAAIETALDRINRITDDVLWLAREGRDIGSMDAVVLHDMMEVAWSMVADRAEHAGLRYADELSTITIEADDDRLCQLLENLFRNAIEHGGEDVTVTVGAVDDGFYVEDDGPGIPEESRDDVFTAGYSTGEDGTGFGLSIVKRIVEAHEWEIHVLESAEGGARFEITGVEFVTG